jgi:hypothetical protein
MQRSVMLNNDFLEKKATAAGVVDAGEKIT